MAITRKGWRKIVVDGVGYKWSIRKEASYWNNIACANMRFTVESATGSLLVVELNRPRLDYWLYPESGEMKAVMPHEVASEIRNAITEGYSLDLKTKPFLHKGI